LSSCQAAAWCLEPLKTMRSEPPRNVKALPVGPAGSGATPTLARAAFDHVSSSVRLTEPRTHGPPIQTPSLPPLNWFSTCVPSRSSIALSNVPSWMSWVMKRTPCSAWGELIVEVLLSGESSEPPAAPTKGMTSWTRSNALPPGWPKGAIGLPPIVGALALIVSSDWRKVSGP
jgi:hypothetical protein